jgi:RimJ/RimL family protein N-acetyltransferase
MPTEPDFPLPPPRPLLRAERLYLRPAERGDIPRFVRWLSDADVMRNLAMRLPMSTPLEEAWFERMLEAQGKTGYHFVICLLDDGRPIGTAGLEGLDWENGSAMFGILIGEKDEWGKGYATETLNAICDFAFGELRIERVWLEVYAENTRGIRAYEKAGFRHEGTRRHARFQRGEHQDAHVMSLLRDEWHALDRKRSWEY